MFFIEGYMEMFQVTHTCERRTAWKPKFDRFFFTKDYREIEFKMVSKENAIRWVEILMDEANRTYC
jgi:hypothetical protein